MNDETMELLDAAIKKEVESQSYYLAALEKTTNPVVQGLLRGLAEEEGQHIFKVGRLKGLKSDEWLQKKINELKNSELIESDVISPEVGIDQILKAAIHREQLSIEFYSDMMKVLESKTARAICEELGREEMRHKAKLDRMYNDLFLK